jgi:Activator of Hsp90 ATPase homolog 1-like protein
VCNRGTSRHDPDAGKETMVSVWFRARGDGSTEVEVRHTLFPDESMRARHQEGWTGTLDRFGRLLASPEWTREQSTNPIKP